MTVRAAVPSGLPSLGQLAPYRSDPQSFFAGCLDETGAAVRCRLSGDGYVLNDPEDVRHVLLGNTHGYVKARRVTGPRATYPRQLSLLTSEGRRHRRRRRTIQPVFRRAFVEALVERAHANARRLAESWPEGAQVDVHAEMTALSQRNTLEALLGSAMEGRVETLAAATAARRSAFERHFFSLFPLPEYLPTATNRRHREASRALRTTIAAEVAGRRARPAQALDLLGLMMATRDEQGRGLSDHALTEEVLTLSVTGYDSVSEGLTWTLYLLAKHPDARETFVAEMEAGEDGSRRPYATGLVRESLRLCPPTWLFVRIARAEDRLPSGTRVRPGERVYLCPYVVHRNPRYWPEPDRFRPERFSGEAADARPRYAYFPFGGGPHVCIGERLAIAQILAVLSEVLSRRRLHLAGSGEVRALGGLSLRPREPLMMRAETRERV